jgi:hypothetical protein
VFLSDGLVVVPIITLVKGSKLMSRVLLSSHVEIVMEGRRQEVSEPALGSNTNGKVNGTVCLHGFLAGHH